MTVMQLALPLPTGTIFRVHQSEPSEKPRHPTKNLVLQMYSADKPYGFNNDRFRHKMIGWACHGLQDLPALNSVYSSLNLSEFLVSAGALWMLRKDMRYREEAISKNIVLLFKEALGNSRYGRWQLPLMDLSEKNQTLYKRMNPFDEDTLTQRLEHIDMGVANTLRKQISEEPWRYHEGRKSEKSLADSYAARICRMIKSIK